MRGHIQKKGNAYYVVLELERSPDGKRRTKWLNVRKELGLPKPATKRQAEQFLVDKLKELNEGTFIEPVEMTVAELLKKWMDVYGKASLRATTRRTYQTYIDNHLVPEIGSIQLAKLKPLHVQQMLTRKLSEGRADGQEGGLAGNSIQYLYKIMRRALESAVTWELVQRNIMDAVTPPKVSRKQPKAWTAEQARQFLSSLGDHRLKPLYTLALSTGMRRGELLGLRWQDVDLQRKKISVNQSLVANKGKVSISEPKTASSRRVIDLSDMEVSLLRKQRKQQREELVSLGQPDSAGDFVFTSERGTAINPRNLLRHFQTACEKAEVLAIPFHGLRHTCATLMLQAGIHPKVVSERLGHAKISITLDLYSHVLPSMQQEAAEKLAKYFEM